MIREEKQESEFMQEVEDKLKSLELWNPETIDFYRVLGLKDRLLIHPLSSYF